jgi:hypothetical protein
VKANIDIVLDCADPNRLSAFWQEALRYRRLAAMRDYVVLVPREGTSPPLVLQRVPEPKSAKNRMHIDLIAEEVEAEVDRLEKLGAHRRHKGLQAIGNTHWVTMADPEDNEFCVCTGVEWT